MELDEMKHAWQALDKRLEQQYTLNLQVYRDGRMDKLRRGLRPLAWGQAIQMLIGVAGLLVLAPIWIANLHDTAVLVAGIVMHTYCVGLIVIGAIVQALIGRINYGAPVLLIQKQLLSLRRTYAVGGALVVGLPWWFLTAPLLVVLTRGAIMVNAPSAIWIQLVIGAAGLLATVWFYHWSHRPERSVLAHKIDDSATGGSIRRAQAMVDEIARFERE